MKNYIHSHLHRIAIEIMHNEIEKNPHLHFCGVFEDEMS